MTEDDYLLVSNWTKIRIAETALRDTLFTSDSAHDVGIVSAISILSKIQSEMSKRLKIN